MENNLEDRIFELEEKVRKLEKLEKKRKTSKIINVVIKIICYVAIVIAAIIAYNYVNDKYIKPFTEEFEKISEGYDNIKKISDKFIP